MASGAPELQYRWCRDRLPKTAALWRLAIRPRFYLPAVDDWHLLHRGPHSRIYRTQEAGAQVLKLILPRSQPRDGARKYLACQARREFRGNLVLTGLGLQAPTVSGWGVTLSPFARFESALFMQALPDFISGLTFVRTETDADRRHDFLCRLAAQLACLHGQNYVHKDAHLANLCILEDRSLAWLDNDIRRPTTIAARRRGLAKTLALLEATGRRDVSAAEWRQFRYNLRSALSHWPAGESLADEIF